MYLKTIEIQGFKSFVGRTVFHFKPGITGIVGPNGSGKSNVADAVRWVLGEQRTSQLRSGNMQDVIFAGTVSRKPLSFASVSITIDNQDHALTTDYSEVTVTRKLYRSGESEYLINREPCRLRDIQELFYDTGVGREGYSLIGQGQIDRIISGNPITRRELLDEAAGIVKHKKRKEAALKKLEEEQNNLVRVDDILAELSAQVGPLKEQSEKARQYLGFRDELKKYDVNRFLLELERADAQIDKDTDSLKVANEQMRAIAAEYEASKSAFSEAEEQIEQIEARGIAARDQLTATDKLKTELEGQIEVLREQIRSALTSKELQKERQRDLQGLITTGEETLRDLTQRFDEEEKRGRKLAEQNDDLTARLAASKEKKETIRTELEELRKAHLDLVREQGEKAADRRKNDVLFAQLRVQCEEDKAAIAKLRTSLKEAADQEGRCQRAGETAEKQWKQASEKSETLKARENELTKELRDAREEANEAASDYQSKHVRLQELRNLTERYEGFGYSVRRVMEEKRASVHGVVADLIRTEKKYSEAIETALGRSLSYVVTDNEETARDLIEYLKKNRYGRATFLPLSAIHPSGAVSGKILKEKGALGPADTLVTFDPEYRDMAAYLLGRTLVVDTLDHAIAIAKKYGHNTRMVTLEGDSFSPGGTMSGGAYKNKSQLLSRRQELEDLTAAVGSAEKHAAACRDRLTELEKALEKLDIQIKDASEKLQEVYTGTRENEVQLENATRERKRLESELAAREQTLADRESQAEKVHKDLQSATGGDQSEEEREKEYARRVAQLEEQSREASDKTREIAVRGEEAHVALAQSRQQAESLKSQILRIRKEQEERLAQIDAFDKDSPDVSVIVKEKEDKIADLQSTIDSSEELFDEIRKEINACEQEKKALMEAHKDSIEQREHLAEERASLEREVLRLNNRIENNDSQRAALTDYMWEEYELAPHAAAELKDEAIGSDLRAIRRRCTELKHFIKDLGDVNVNAIEQYKEVGGRYELMSTQREDIMKAEESVLQVIEELDETMRAQFDAAFAQINDQFDKVFKVLFGGGRGRLELLEDDVLSAGVKVIAQPPGKKLQNMMQLSGGEKSLSAIALLFAIQNLHPSPFCLLDEIEASLDDNNVVRYGDYLKKLSEQTQFIIITHRHGTMNVADRLYGITMQEKGVSTMVSVDLAKEQIEEDDKGHKNE